MLAGHPAHRPPSLQAPLSPLDIAPLSCPSPQPSSSAESKVDACSPCAAHPALLGGTRSLRACHIASIATPLATSAPCSALAATAVAAASLAAAAEPAASLATPLATSALAATAVAAASLASSPFAAAAEPAAAQPATAVGSSALAAAALAAAATATGGDSD